MTIKTLRIFNRQFTGETNDTHHFNEYKLSLTGQKKFISNEAHKVLKKIYNNRELA